jgi:hypothetical protein
MKAVVIVLGVFLSVLSFSSCQKEVTGEIVGSTDSTNVPGSPTGNAAFRVKTYTEDVTSPQGQFVSTYNLSYDTQGRLSNLVSSSGADRYVYTYDLNNTFILDIFSNNVLSVHQLSYLNSYKLVDSTVQYNITTGDTTTEKYIYDANKLLVQYKEYDVINKRSELTSTTSYQYDANRNITKETTGSSQISYEYYPNFVNTLNLGDVYFSRNSNLTKTTTYSGSFSQTLNHTYTFDTMNRITSEKITVSSGEVVIRSYTY